MRRIFNDHDRVIYHDSDCKNQGEQRHKVDSESEQRHRREGTYDRDWYRRRWYQHCAVVLQEQHDDDQHQDSCLEKRHINAVDRILDELRGVVETYILKAGRKCFTHLGHKPACFCRDCQSIGIRQSKDREMRGLLAAKSRKDGILLLAKLDPSDISQPDNGRSFIDCSGVQPRLVYIRDRLALDDYVGELIGIGEPT